MKSFINNKLGVITVALAAGSLLIPAAYADLPTAFTNTGSIVNTRHNLTQSPLYMVVGQSVNPMNGGRNNYGEVCVYCHTPHGASNTIAAPLWNRTTRATNYETYNELGTSTLTQDVLGTPGPASLTCLSCHDGQTAMDSIINMPTTQTLSGALATKHGNGLQGQESTQSTAFLNSWNNAAVVPGSADATNHMGFNSRTFPGGYTLGVGDGSDGVGCMACHSDVGLITATLGFNYADFQMANLGTDLRNDHPIGVTFPAAAIAGTNNEDFNQPAGLTAQGGSNYFDENGDSKMQKNEIRTYDGRVECASCHDPHGVVPPGAGLQFNPTFLRKPQEAATPSGVGSRVCFTCHNK